MGSKVKDYEILYKSAKLIKTMQNSIKEGRRVRKSNNDCKGIKSARRL